MAHYVNSFIFQQNDRFIIQSNNYNLRLSWTAIRILILLYRYLYIEAGGSSSFLYFKIIIKISFRINNKKNIISTNLNPLRNFRKISVGRLVCAERLYNYLFHFYFRKCTGHKLPFRNLKPINTFFWSDGRQTNLNFY